MRRLPALLIFAVVAGSTACSSAIRSADRVELDEGTLRAGMSEDDAEALLGPPDHRAAGSVVCRYAGSFYDVRPDRQTVELAWRRPGRVVVAYLRGPIITNVGVIPTR